MFSGKTILITGASSGLGRVLAIEASRRNASLVLMARNRAQLEETRAACVNAKMVELVTGDVRIAENCAHAVAETVLRFGRLDYLLLNAGISMWSAFEKLDDISILRNIMETNYLGAVQCILPAIPHLKINRGMIIAISSIQGKIAVPWHSGYSASKHALQAFLDTLRMELKNQIDVLTVSPGWIQGTELKKNAYRQNEITELGAHHSDAVTSEECVRKILQAMLARKKELILPSQYRLLPWLRLCCPALLEFLLMKKLRSSQ